jgi:uncharacterized membrane protein YgcG
MTMTRRHLLAILAGAATLPLLAACPATSASEPAAEEVEDCDTGALLEGDSDCYSEAGKPKPAKTNARTKTNTGGTKSRPGGSGSGSRSGGGSKSSRR